MIDAGIQVHAPPLEVNASALDGAHAAWLATSPTFEGVFSGANDGPEWGEYKAARHAYCCKLQKSFESYQNAAWDAWSSLRRFRDPGRQARKAYFRRVIEEATGRLEKLNANDAGPSSEVVEAWYALQRAKFDLEVASFPIRSRRSIPTQSRAEARAAREAKYREVGEWFAAQRIAPLTFE